MPTGLLILDNLESNSTLSGADADDTLMGLDGNDTLQGLAGDDILEGGDGNDSLAAGTGLDTLSGDDGDDTLRGSEQDNWMFGGPGNDSLLGLGGADLLLGDAGNDMLVGGDGNDTLEGGDGNDTLFGQDGNDLIIGGAGNDTFTDKHYSGTDTMQGGAGNDNYQKDNAQEIIIEGVDEGPRDTLVFNFQPNASDVPANVEVLTLGGNRTAGTVWTLYDNYGLDHELAGNDYFNDIIYAYEGNDKIIGNKGIPGVSAVQSDTLHGGRGNDSYLLFNLTDQIVELQGEGSDDNIEGYFVDAPGTEVFFTMPEQVEILNVRGSESAGIFKHVIHATGNSTANIISGNASDQTIDGAGGDDSLYGARGRDSVVGGIGNDVLVDGWIATIANGVLIDKGWGLSRNMELPLYDDGSIDTLAGGTGDDTYHVYNEADVIVEDAESGFDTVVLHLIRQYTARDGIEQLDATSTTGSSTLTGNALDNVLMGSLYADRLDGGTGNDTLAGNLGANTLIGGLGDDTYVVNNAAETLQEAASSGTDTVLSAIDFDLQSQPNIENLTLDGTQFINGTGNNLDNLLVGNSGDNVLRGLAGADTLRGGHGSDTYFIDSTDVVEEVEDMDAFGNIIGDGGIDTIHTNFHNQSLDGGASLFALGSLFENVVLQTGATNALGNDKDNSMTGNGASNLLFGGAGSDILDGQAGADTLQGGLGDDSYIVDNVNDIVEELENEGTDSVVSNVSFSLLNTHIENLEITGTDLETLRVGVGNAADNNLVSVAHGPIQLEGLGGNDTLSIYASSTPSVSLLGGTGDDTYHIIGGYYAPGVGITINLIEAPGEGIDSVIVPGGTDFTLPANIENATITSQSGNGGTNLRNPRRLAGNELNNILNGSANPDTILGMAGNDSLYGDFGNDTLDGGSGTDTLFGGWGNDIYLVDSLSDVLIERANQGFDTIISSVLDYQLPVHVERILFSLKGDGAANTLNGTSGNDTLDGAAGADTLVGGLGDDTYLVDTAADVISELADQGTDTAKASASFVLPDFVEQLVLTGNGHISGTGNALGNLITGNVGNNNLDGGTGADTLQGGDGSDTYYVDNSADVVIETQPNQTDTIISSVTYTLPANTENLTLTGDTDIDATGNAASNQLEGNSGNNRLEGGDGSDNLSGEIGFDTLVGGDGDDAYHLSDLLDMVVETASGGTSDYISIFSDEELPSQFFMPDHVEQLSIDEPVESFKSTFVIAGNAEGNWIDYLNRNYDVSTLGRLKVAGGAGNDTLSSSYGVSEVVFEGGLGDDVVYINDTPVAVIEAANEGLDTVVLSIHLSATYQLEANVENIQIGGGYNEFGTNLSVLGNAEHNHIDGTNYYDWLGLFIDAQAGNDTLVGNDPSATGIIDRADTLIGGLGDDIYSIFDQGAVLVENAHEGIDWVHLNGVGAYTLGENIENLLVSAPSGNQGSVLHGNAQSNLIMGHQHNDTLDGGSGDDALNGSAGQDVLMGGDGNDQLNGGADGDLMTGGNGNDRYVVDSLSDQITESEDQGIDWVDSSVSISLSAHVEHLRLTAGASQGQGNARDNRLIGNAADNSLSGLDGNDSLSGMDGHDNLDGGAGNDLLNGGQGNDMLIDMVGNNSFYGGDGDDRLIGGVGDDWMLGGAGNDVFWGMEGNDMLIGGQGADQYIVGSYENRAVLVSDHDNIVQGADLLTLNGNPYATLFKRAGNDLLITQLGHAGSVTVLSWFLEPHRQIETIVSGGQSLVEPSVFFEGELQVSQVQGLVDVMAGFDAGGALEISAASHASVFAAIEQAWQISVYS